MNVPVVRYIVIDFKISCFAMFKKVWIWVIFKEIDFEPFQILIMRSPRENLYFKQRGYQ